MYGSREVADRTFDIAGGKAGMKVSWQLTGIRHDAWAEANRTPVELDETPGEHRRAQPATGPR